MKARDFVLALVAFALAVAAEMREVPSCAPSTTRRSPTATGAAAITRGNDARPKKSYAEPGPSQATRTP
ncbi:MAG TPA: hypothetical protein VK714_06605 [Myxococcota bacterium]|nr:hypothetical protein [Myxococcota bacterium]